VSDDKRQVVVVDLETTGFNHKVHHVVECAWWNLDTDERGHFVPLHNVREALASANVQSLRINRYIDRLASAPQDTSGEGARRLAEQLEGNVLAGSNPTFDARFLPRMYAPYVAADLVFEPTWHHRLWDLSAYAAGVLGLDELPGLARVCELLGYKPGDHTAEGDVTAAGYCFKALRQLTGERNRYRIKV
jgi:DNA polymerase-3 subunit epsilon